jgi:fumarate reductase flavoprotein subunit
MTVDGRATLDAVVIGGGIAGLSAALRAAELGMRTVLLEKGGTPQYPCNTRYSGGVFHVAASSPKAPPEQLLAAIAAKTKNTADPSLAAALAGNAAATMDWLRNHGGKFVKGARQENFAWMAAPPRMWVRRSNWWDTWSGRGPDLLLRALALRLKLFGGELLLGARAQTLIIEGERCAGVEAIVAGAAVRFHAHAVVLADGGFQSDPALMRAHVTSDFAAVKQRNTLTGSGDGLRMALAAGAATTGLGDFYGHVLSRDAFTNDHVWPYPLLDDLATAGIVVDRTGRRFVDEGNGGIYVANRIAAHMDPLSAMVICDTRAWNGPGRQRRISANPQLLRASATLYMADTVEALAGLAGLSSDAVTRTIDAYNRAVRSDASIGLEPRRSTRQHPPVPVDTPPYYAIPACAGVTYTMGGMRIDAHARVVRPDGGPIAGLYAAGSNTGGLEGGGRAFHIGGLARAAVFGKLAAEHIASVVAARRLRDAA